MNNLRLENIKLRTEHALLTEQSNGNLSDIELLEARIELNETLVAVQNYLNEGTIEKVKGHLKKNWKKYALGALAAGAAAGAAYGSKKYYDRAQSNGNTVTDQASKDLKQGVELAKEKAKEIDQSTGGYVRAATEGVKKQSFKNKQSEVTNRMKEEIKKIQASNDLTAAQKADATRKTIEAEQDTLRNLKA